MHNNWNIDYDTGNIRYVGPDHGEDGATYHSIHFFRKHILNEIRVTDPKKIAYWPDWVLELMPPFNIDDTASQHLYDGSIIQKGPGGGDTIYDGFVVFGHLGFRMRIHDYSGMPVSCSEFWNPNLNADPDRGWAFRFILKTQEDGVGFIRGEGLTAFYDQVKGMVFHVRKPARGINVIALNGKY